jgi:hypothetical protein
VPTLIGVEGNVNVLGNMGCQGVNEPFLDRARRRGGRYKADPSFNTLQPLV